MTKRFERNGVKFICLDTLSGGGYFVELQPVNTGRIIKKRNDSVGGKQGSRNGTDDKDI